MKLEGLNKARYIIHLIKEYKYFLEVKRKCWDELSITKKETNYILKTAYGFLSKEIKADEILAGLITETIQNRIEMLKQELVELGVEMEELEDE
ncbi:TPA: hypothetical protein ACKCFY_000738 [Streptococcus pneumoniae]|uniref:hypothetical protein n=1 Tax=Streptococcus pneumoniae TaxID=1313 RepID=UPI0014594AC6|nr:hypothetical protein [Streptococcus pneumoniae]DAR28909.1 MAG TPA: hypothetical protein [Caudoviricetes sp.]NMH08010.1 hypothetical protein [Streptococcus pneumoniae]NMH13848.1 hypothetical protein [Streptococcus pneumoniae]HET1798031.1 hypothetical protein [Streptococcus pneumoniae]HEW9786490.1 hypothetical protein [Streptococcus pneumoniae]